MSACIPATFPARIANREDFRLFLKLDLLVYGRRCWHACHKLSKPTLRCQRALRRVLYRANQLDLLGQAIWKLAPFPLTQLLVQTASSAPPGIFARGQGPTIASLMRVSPKAVVAAVRVGDGVAAGANLALKNDGGGPAEYVGAPARKNPGDGLNSAILLSVARQEPTLVALEEVFRCPSK